MDFQVFVGFDPREVDAYQVAVHSLRAHCPGARVEPLLLPHLRGLGLYRRPHERRDGGLWDVISGAPMATEFAITRFLVPHLARTDWAIFCDGDFLWRADIGALAALADPRCAVMVVPHDYRPMEAMKMDGQVQTRYARKNWSSLMLWNCRHPAHARLPELVNRWAGRRLHAFEWLDDAQIGHLPEAWNWLEGHSSLAIDPKAVHFTRGTPDMAGYEAVDFADEWRAAREAAASPAPAAAALSATAPGTG